MFEDFRSQFAVVAFRVVYHDRLAIRSDVFASHLDRPVAVTQGWRTILHGIATEEGVDIVDGIVVDHAPVEPNTFDQRCGRFERSDGVTVCGEYGRGFDEHYEYRRCGRNLFDRSAESQTNLSQVFAVLQSVSKRDSSWDCILQFLFCLRSSHSYYLTKAKQIAASSNVTISEKLAWALTSYGYKFLTTHPFLNDKSYNNNNELFSTTTNSSHPLSIVKRDYRQHLLERALQCLIGVGTARNEVKIDSDASETSQISDVLSYTKLLIECSDDDPLSAWWSNLLSTAAFWLLGDDSEAEKYHQLIQKMPKSFAAIENSLPVALIRVFNAKKSLL